MISPPPIPGFLVEIHDFAGLSPVEGTGRIADPAPAEIFGADTDLARDAERDWYFRARGQHWSVAIGRRVNAGGNVRPDGADLYVSGPADDIRPYAAGHMADDECERHLTFALTLWAAGFRGRVALPDPPEMRPPCFRCGDEADHRVGGLSVCSGHLDEVTTALGAKEGSK